MITRDAFDLLLPKPADPPTTFRWASVTQTSPLRVRLDGEADPLPITPDTLLAPSALSVGTRVRVEVANRRIVVHGAAGQGALNTAVLLGANINLNTVVEPGTYVQRLTAQATTALNYPEGRAGILEVLGSGLPGEMLWQRWTAYAGSGSTDQQRAVFQRSFYSGVWTGWQIMHRHGLYTPTWASGVSDHGSYASPRIYRDGELAFMTPGFLLRTTGAVTPGTGAGIIPAGGIPAELRPSKAVYIPGGILFYSTSANFTGGFIALGADGALTAYPQSSLSGFSSMVLGGFHWGIF